MSILNHPCFGQVPAGQFGRIHLPVAPKCNLQCGFCDRRFDCANESRPGVCSKLISPEEAVETVREAIEKQPRITVAGIAGPGDTLFNEESYETLRLIHEKLPQMILCISTNGILLEKRLDELVSCGVQTITVTVNAYNASTATKIYDRIYWDNEWMETNEDVMREFLSTQIRGIAKAASKGIIVKVNTVLVPGINEDEVGNIAFLASEAGASIHNIIPLIPCARMSDLQAPTKEQLEKAYEKSGNFLDILHNCKHCRADACGLL